MEEVGGSNPPQPTSTDATTARDLRVSRVVSVVWRSADLNQTSRSVRAERGRTSRRGSQSAPTHTSRVARLRATRVARLEGFEPRKSRAANAVSEHVFRRFTIRPHPLLLTQRPRETSVSLASSRLCGVRADLNSARRSASDSERPSCSSSQSAPTHSLKPSPRSDCSVASREVLV